MSDEVRPEVVIGNADSDRIAIRALGRLHAGASDFWDGNWLVTPVEIVAGDFRATVGASLRAEELQRFRKSLEHLYNTLQGEAVLESLEAWLTLRVALGGSGQLTVDGKITDRPGGGNELRFDITGLDATYLPAIIALLEELETLFPVIGSP